MPNFSSVLPASLITGRSVSDPLRIPTVTPAAPLPAVTLKSPVAQVPEPQPKPRSGHRAEFFRLLRRGTANRAAHVTRPVVPDEFHPSASTDRTAALSQASCRRYAGAGPRSDAENPLRESRYFPSLRRPVYPTSPGSPRP